MNQITQIFKDSLSITIFVLIMMLIIEYINVLSKGSISKKLRRKPFVQVLTGALLGLIPGCMGTYTAVSLFTHNIFSLGALTACMIATSGDEAFFLIAFSPEKAFFIFSILFILSIIVGVTINYFSSHEKFHQGNHKLMHEESCGCFHKDTILYLKQLKNISFPRAILLFGTVVFIFMLITGNIGHNHLMESISHNHNHLHDHSNFSFELNWFNTTFLISSLILLFIVLHVPDSFLEKHLWDHIIKKHFIKVLVWTLVVLFVIKLLLSNFEITGFLHSYKYVVLAIALLVGLIPESGPHMIFITMYASGNLPISILIANSIVQDGHGALPLFAESPKNFLKIKAINIGVGAIVGASGLFLGF